MKDSLSDRLSRYSSMTLRQAIDVADSMGGDVHTPSPLLAAFAVGVLADFARTSLESAPNARPEGVAE